MQEALAQAHAHQHEHAQKEKMSRVEAIKGMGHGRMSCKEEAVWTCTGTGARTRTCYARTIGLLTPDVSATVGSPHGTAAKQ